MYEGLLPVWKPIGMTSHDVVFKLRKILHMKKIGHTGTLDPDVEGVLLICLGKGTKLVEFMMEGRKIYQGEITLGYSTTTEDASGDIVEVKSVENPIPNLVIDQAMQNFIGEITQIPPMYSAVKVNGRKLYEYARDNIKVERPIRKTEIYQFNRCSESTYSSQKKIQKWKFKVECSKGTYVRTLAVDLGARLGYPAHMSQLVRYATGGFTKEDCYTIEQIIEMTNNNLIKDCIVPVEKAELQFPIIEMNEQQYCDVINGKVLPEDYFGSNIYQNTCLYYDHKLIAIYYPHPTKEKLIKPRKMFI